MRWKQLSPEFSDISGFEHSIDCGKSLDLLSAGLILSPFSSTYDWVILNFNILLAGEE